MFTPPPYPISRPRRTRIHPTIRKLTRDVYLNMDDIIYPIFIREGSGPSLPIKSMPGQKQITLEDLPREVDEMVEAGITSLMLFGLPEHKDNAGSNNVSQAGIVPSAIRMIKERHPDLYLMSDICLCDFADHGHCFTLNSDDTFNQQQTLGYLQKSTVIHAQAGADLVAPSGMVDGMITTMRSALDEAGYAELPIMSYAVKYASAFYGPFRDALESPPRFGDRKSYQMDFQNTSEALKECAIDINEGADILMVKPAMSYLDTIHRVKDAFPVPLAAYQVSGEFSMLHAAADRGMIDLRSAALESLLGIKRSGADMILTYFAKDIQKWIK